MKKNKGVLWLAAILLLAAGVPLSLLGLFISRIGSEVDNSQISETVQAAVVPSHSPVSALPSPSPSPTQIPTSTPISTFTPSPTPTPAPVPTPTENPYSVEQFAMLYDGAIPQYHVVAFLIGEIPDWLTVSACLYNGVDERELTFDMRDDMYPNGDFEADEVELWYPSQVIIKFHYSLNDVALEELGEIQNLILPQDSYVEFVIDDWAFDEFEDGNLHENVDDYAAISFVDKGGNYIDDTYVFDPEIVIYSLS